MDNTRQQIVDSIKSSSNILVTVSTNPSVDELSAALGLTIILNKMDKRSTSVVSGVIPAAINFLEPNKTFENSADSLRDFIIALDKEKADHLRYKVDGDVVKIFITPYKTTLSQGDLEFSQGDYNVELVIALGVKDQDHLDKALDAHGKILHDAKVITVTTGSEASKLGSIDWHDGAASSLCEMVVSLADGLKSGPTLLDEQISTALLTGIVSSTDRFSNDRTSSQVMTMAAQLMAAGANQQLIAAKLEEAHDIAPDRLTNSSTSNVNGNSGSNSSNNNGTELIIERDDSKSNSAAVGTEKVIEPLPVQENPFESVSQASPETLDQLELEKQLADINTPVTGTMEDIEKELQNATDTTTETNPVEQLAQPSDASMPGFEPTALFAPSAPLQPETPNEIINEHGTISAPPLESAPPINSIQSDVNDGEVTIDPFNMPLTPLEVPPVMPDATGSGTAEGAALLATPDIVETPPPQAAPEIPNLPPLPPLPSDSSLPPLPPPPPPPNFGQPFNPTQSLSGAVSGDVFGDASTAAPVADAPAPPAPGQFKIPGQ